VCSFLREKEVDEEIVALFREARVDGSQFLSLNDDSLKALGIKRAMDRGFITTRTICFYGFQLIFFRNLKVEL